MRVVRWKRAGKPRVIALHGFSGSPEDFELPASQTGVEWVCLELPGHAAADAAPAPDNAFSIGFVEALVHAACQQEPERPTLLLGYSLGARLLLQLLGRDPLPDCVRGIVTIGGTPGIEDATGRAARLAADKTLANTMRSNGIQWFAQSWPDTPILRSQANIPQPWLDRLRQRRLLKSVNGLARALESFSPGRLPSGWERLGSLVIPLLALSGANDDKFCAVAERMQAAHPKKVQSQAIAQAGHTAHLENCPEFCGAFTVFTQNVIE